MTGFESKRRAAQDKLDDEPDTLLIVYQRGFADGKKAAQPAQEPVALVIDGVLVKSELPEKYTGHLYTTPSAAQRQWLGLEIEEVQDSYNADYQAQTRAVEKLLKERNT